MPKSKRLTLSLFFFMLAGAGYFSTVSQFAIHPLLKDYLVIVPLQVLAIVYIFLLRREHIPSETSLGHRSEPASFD